MAKRHFNQDDEYDLPFNFSDDGQDRSVTSHGEDLLIVNNGDGEWSDPFEQDMLLTHEEGGEAAIIGILVGLLLPAVDKVPEHEPPHETADVFEEPAVFEIA